jgi:hypothetical protein
MTYIYQSASGYELESLMCSECNEDMVGEQV